MPELLATVEAKQAEDYESKKFTAALKGVDLDKQNSAGMQKFKELQAKAASNGQAKSANDIVGLQGAAAEQAGFGIGFGLDYETK